MAKSLQAVISILVIIAAVLWSKYGIMPLEISSADVPETEFSTLRAYRHVEEIAQQPHYVGSPAHSRVRNYIVSELQEMDLLVHTQERYSLSKSGNITRPQNIISRIEGSGSGKALLLLTHYDSAVHSSPGASDAASGVATILEGIRAYLASGAEPVNDIIIVFTDGEELGLNGADSFVNEHPWAKDIGLALNFESRGSGGKSFMLLETNSGNKTLIKEFIKANSEYPVTNSLAYSVYKMLPNDTDLTVLREQGDINGFNFAFIDDHFDYHTATDIPANLDLRTLAHQGSYLMPLLKYFSEQPLETFDAFEDVIYFNIPVLGMVNYPFSWSLPLVIFSLILLGALVVYGKLKRRLHLPEVLKGFVPLLLSVFGAGILSFAFWKICLFLYPEYSEMEHGFTYNGYYYLTAVVFLVLGICFVVYSRFRKPDNSRQLFIAPLIIWILISAGATFYLKGAAYFIIPVYFGLLQLFILIQQKKPNLILLAILCLPAIFIVQPFIESFAVALGLRILFVTALLTALLWVLLWPVFGLIRKNRSLASLSFLGFFVLFLVAHFNSGFNEERPKPNSLVYILDADAQIASWNTYDELLDPWTKTYFNESAEERPIDTRFSSKYNSGFEKSVKAPVIDIPEPFVSVEKSENAEGNMGYRVKIAPRRDMNRMELFIDRNINFESFLVNDLEATPVSTEEGSYHIFKNRWSDRFLTYYAVNRDTLRLEFSLRPGVNPTISLYEASHDLPENPELQVPPRTKEMIPRPFVLNDAVVIKKTIGLD